MAHEGPSSLPTFYGEKPPEGQVIKRPSDEEDLLASSPMMSQEKAPDHGRESAFRPEPPLGTSRTRWSLDDARREEYWKGYWDRKRLERERDRESHWYPEYRGPMRYIEYPDEEDRPRAVFRSSSRRETRPPPPGPSSRARKSFDGDMLPPKRHNENDYDEEYVEMIYPEERGRRRGPPPVPPHRSSLDSSSAAMRLPFLSWMGTTIKGRAFPSIGLSISLLTSYLRFCGSSRRICWHDNVSILRLCWNPGRLIPPTMP
jgi:hypothetical protein